MTDVYAIFGWPVAHSRSPAMHNAAFAALGLDALYLPLAVTPEKLADAVLAARALAIRGFNVTLPHKSAILPLLDDVEPSARAIGAVNTVVSKNGKLLGSNTDAEGLARSLAEAKVVLRGANVVILGAGGAARAAAVGLAEAGAQRITVAARQEAQASLLTEALASHCKPARLEATGMNAKALEAACAGASLLVQATSATLASADADAFAAALPMHALARTAVVCDLVYKPRQTTVLKRAQALGLATVDGLGMLLHQGGLAFERFTGHSAPLAAMRDALLTA